MSRSFNLLTIQTLLSSLNHRRKARRRDHKLQSGFDRWLASATATNAAEIEEALSLICPVAIDLPMVRIGPENDGGYIIPDDFDGITALYSPGVSSEIGFDRQIAEKGISCYLADASVEAPADMPDNMHFRQNFIGTHGKSPFITMREWIHESSPGSDDLMLQMDIEGAEYDVIAHMEETLLSRFRIIAIELHDLEKLTDATWRRRFTLVLSKLNKAHVLCHLHANNTAGSFRFGDKFIPQVVELTLIRSDRVRSSATPAAIPHPLDRPNSPKLPEVRSPLFWTK